MPRRTEGLPHDRLTRIADRLLTVVEADPEYQDGDKCIVFMDGDNHGGLGMHGYDSDTEAMVNLFVHLKAIFAANGRTLMVMPIGSDQ